MAKATKKAERQKQKFLRIRAERKYNKTRLLCCYGPNNWRDNKNTERPTKPK